MSSTNRLELIGFAGGDGTPTTPLAKLAWELADRIKEAAKLVAKTPFARQDELDEQRRCVIQLIGRSTVKWDTLAKNLTNSGGLPLSTHLLTPTPLSTHTTPTLPNACIGTQP